MSQEPNRKQVAAVRDITGVLGIALLGIGAGAQWGWPVGTMTVGLVLLGLVLTGARR